MTHKPKPPLFDSCANGCEAPVCPPSRVICRGCMDRITANLEAIEQRTEGCALAEAEKIGRVK